MRVQTLLKVICSATLPVYAQNNTTWSFQTLKALPGFEPPELEISTISGTTALVIILFPMSGSGTHNYSPNIYQQDGELVWQSGYGDYAAIKPTTRFGEPALAAGSSIGFPEPWSFKYGIVKILDQNYENIYNGTSCNTSYPTHESIYPLYDPTHYGPFIRIDMHKNNATPAAPCL